MSDQSRDCAVPNPEFKLEHVRVRHNTNTCDGRGRETASSRGYNAEKLAALVMHPMELCLVVSFDPWYDDYTSTNEELSYQTEVKSCVDRYETESGEEGGYGQFRIWKHHHERLLEEHKELAEFGQEAMYFFVVYTIESGIEKEVGKLVAPIEMIDEALDTWSTANHVTMGEQKNRRISWRLLLKKLGVSRERFENEDIINLIND